MRDTYIIAHESSEKYGVSRASNKIKKPIVYLMAWLAMSLYQQLVKVLYVSDLNGTGIFIQIFYVVVFWCKIIEDFTLFGAWQCHSTDVKTKAIWAEIIYKCMQLSKVNESKTYF